jgi:hypothetical protein
MSNLRALLPEIWLVVIHTPKSNWRKELSILAEYGTDSDNIKLRKNQYIQHKTFKADIKQLQRYLGGKTTEIKDRPHTEKVKFYCKSLWGEGIT